MAWAGESRRQLVHALLVLPVLTLPYLSQIEATLIALVAVAMNAFLLPRLKFTRSLFRPDEKRLGGIVIYPLTIGGVIFLTPESLYPWVPGVAWVTLSIGDALATGVGQSISSPRLPWNRNKSLLGSLAFLCGTGLAVTGILIYWDFTPMAALRWGGLAAIVGTLAESLPLPWDDNWTVPIVTALVLGVLA